MDRQIAVALATALLMPSEMQAAATQHLSFPPTVTLQDGTTFTPSARTGKPVVINFWASWCVPCRTELPSLDRLATMHPELIVVAASVDEDHDVARRNFSARYPHLKLGFSKLAEVQQFGALGMPYTVIFSHQGTEVARVPRAIDWQGNAAIKALTSAR